MTILQSSLANHVVDALIEQGKLTSAEGTVAKTSSEPYLHLLDKVEGRDIADILGSYTGDEAVGYDEYDNITDTAKPFGDKLAQHHCLIYKITTDDLFVVMPNTTNEAALNAIDELVGKDIGDRHTHYRTGSLSGIKQALSRYSYATRSQDGDKLSTLLKNASSDASSEISDWRATPAGLAIEAIVVDAMRSDVTDIHLRHIGDNRALVNYRVNGDIIQREITEKTSMSQIVGAIKSAAGMDVSKIDSVPQDGAITGQFDGESITMRANIIPTQRGERCTIRILRSAGSKRVTLKGLKFYPDEMQRIHQGMSIQSGMILVTGPTGSGKNTTLFAMLNDYHDERKTYFTLEDPIEYEIPYADQTQVDDKLLTFADGLRALLRQDPDTIMVGEIRDEETASVAYKGANTGHLMLSTLHTNSTFATVQRMKDLGVDNMSIALATNLFIAQRLAKQSCPYCQEELFCDEETILKHIPSLDLALAKSRGYLNKNYAINKGCNKCQSRGYSGRRAVPEVVFVDLAMSDMIFEERFMDVKRHILDNKWDLMHALMRRASDRILSIHEVGKLIGRG